MSNQGHLTGRTAFRRNWRGKLILQVEVRLTYVSGGGACTDIQAGVIWRDAVLEDFARNGFALTFKLPVPTENSNG